MEKKQWYEELFTNYAKTYDNEDFTKGTLAEVDFIEKELGYDKSLKILDIGCGTGRHAIELAGRGYNVLGVDLSESQLARAREKAGEAGVKLIFEQADARKLVYDREFDLAIMLCEGGFSLMESDAMNFSILESAARALKPGGKFIFTCLNALFPLYHSVKDFMDKNSVDGTTHENSFDLMTFRDSSRYDIKDDDGKEKSLDCNERFYAPSEITWMLHTLGFENTGIYGCNIGLFSRDNPLTTDNFEMLVISKKKINIC